MAESRCLKLSDVFDHLWKLHDLLETTDESTTSDTIQKKIEDGVRNGEVGIKMVNELELFSNNEEIDEVASNEIRYLLFPGLLGYLTNKNSRLDRIDVVKKAKAYYMDFLMLCKLYNVADFDIPKLKAPKSEGEETEDGGNRAQIPHYLSMADRRKVKIERFKKQKENERKLKDLYDKVKEEHVDDEVKRDYYLTLLNTWIYSSMEELESIEDEISILNHMVKMKSSGANARPAKSDDRPKSKFRPFILTKNEIQKKVIGAGYPSLPTYSIEEWYDQQVAEGKLPGPGDTPPMPDPVVQAKEYERQDLEKESNIENDDPETLQKAREWDDWKDDHRRGWGHRQNMG